MAKRVSFFHSCFSGTQRISPWLAFIVFGLFFAAALGPLSSLALAAEGYTLSPVPAWVEKIQPEAPGDMPEKQLSNGTYYLLVDEQVKVEREDLSVFRHLAVQLLTPAGVESRSQLSLDFDPSYERLDIHYIHLLRGGKTIDALNPEQIRIIQRETQLDYLIYNGDKTASIFLEDVRPGDILDYAYSVHGANPAFDGMYSDAFSIQWSLPVARHYNRLLWPKDRQLYTRVHLKDGRPAERITGNHREYVWDQSNLEPVLADDQLPEWFTAYPWIQYTEFASWDDLRDWGLKRYTTAPTPEPAIARILEDILEPGSSPKKQTAAIFSFVQNEIRYLGIEVGAGGYVPRPPETTLKRRFGDCKDKTMLAISMLRHQGITACPVLVNTRRKHMLETRLPSPGLFNHVIVQVELEGQNYWLDPTLTHYKGNFDHLYQPDYRKGLALCPGNTGLQTKESPDQGPTEVIKETWDFRKGREMPARLFVETTYKGWQAASQRNNISSTSHKDLEKDYLNYYAQYYPEIEKRLDLEIADDPETNTLTIREFYVVPNSWEEKSHAHTFDLSAHEFEKFVDAPSTLKRKMPLHLGYPANTLKETRVQLFNEFDVEPETTVIENPMLKFEFSQLYNEGPREIVLKYHYQSKQDHVPVELFDRYLKDIEEIEDNLYDTLRDYPDEPEEEESGLAAFYRDMPDLLTPVNLVAGILILSLVLGLILSILECIRDHKQLAGLNARYYPAGMFKFIVLCVFTFGFYEYYWFFLNWRYIKKRHSIKIWPWARALFAPFLLYAFYKILLRYNAQEDSPVFAMPRLRAVLLAITYFLLSAFNEKLPYLPLGFLPLLPFVLHINNLNSGNLSVQQFSVKWRFRHLFAILVGAGFYCLFILEALGIF